MKLFRIIRCEKCNVEIKKGEVYETLINHPKYKLLCPNCCATVAWRASDDEEWHVIEYTKR